MNAADRKLLLSQGRNEYGHYGVNQIFCNKCHEPKKAEETTGNHLRRICFNCVVLEWRLQRLHILELRRQRADFKKLVSAKAYHKIVFLNH